MAMVDVKIAANFRRTQSPSQLRVVSCIFSDGELIRTRTLERSEQVKIAIRTAAVCFDR